LTLGQSKFQLLLLGQAIDTVVVLDPLRCRKLNSASLNFFLRRLLAPADGTTKALRFDEQLAIAALSTRSLQRGLEPLGLLFLGIEYAL
jgi:hypothetical protein